MGDRLFLDRMENYLDMNRINWLMMAVFVLLIAGICGAVIAGQSQPADSQEIKIQFDDLQAAAAEGVYISDNANGQNDNYFQAQLEDLEQNVTGNRDQIEKSPYDPAITVQRKQYLAISKQVSDLLHQLSQQFHDPGQIAALQDQLNQIKDSLGKLK
jgi:hypothetical protein